MRNIIAIFILFSCLNSKAISPEYFDADHPRTVFIQMFEWPWQDIAIECENTLGPMGISAVQVSPPHEHIKRPNSPWWERYQVISYLIQSRSGDEAEFANMVQRCKKSGVDIYADAVINHMAGFDSGESWLGRIFSHLFYKDLYTAKDFHDCGRNQNNDIFNFDDLYELQNCELLNLADLKTEDDSVQNKIANYLNHMIDLGVAGFRIDAAKHIPARDLQQIKNKLKKEIYFAQELIASPGGVVPVHEYAQVGDISEYNFPFFISRILKDQELFRISETLKWQTKSEDAIVFVTNHDLERSKDQEFLLTLKSNPRLYYLAQVLMLTWPYGYPQIYSGYNFKEYDEGPPVENNLVARSVFDSTLQCLEPWTCEHRLFWVKALVKFRNATNSNFYVTKSWTNGSNQLAFSRGSKGFVAINSSAQKLLREFSTDLAPGFYCNQLDQICKTQFEVKSNHKVVVKLEPYSALVIYGEEK